MPVIYVLPGGDFAAARAREWGLNAISHTGGREFDPAALVDDDSLALHLGTLVEAAVVYFGHGHPEKWFCPTKALTLLTSKRAHHVASLGQRRVVAVACYTGSQMADACAAKGSSYVGFTNEVPVPIERTARSAVQDCFVHLVTDSVSATDKSLAATAASVVDSHLDFWRRRRDQGAAGAFEAYRALRTIRSLLRVTLKSQDP